MKKTIVVSLFWEPNKKLFAFVQAEKGVPVSKIKRRPTRMSFRTTVEEHARTIESARIRRKFTDKLPVVVESAIGANVWETLLCPKTMTWVQLERHVHTRRHQPNTNTSHGVLVLLKQGEGVVYKTVEDAYAKYADDDGFLYTRIHEEQVGNDI